MGDGLWEDEEEVATNERGGGGGGIKVVYRLLRSQKDVELYTVLTRN